MFSVLLQMDGVGVPSGVIDLWECTGRRKEAAYTWDTYRNDNLGHEGGWRTKLRFDRLFLRQPAAGAKVKPVYFELLGLERLPQVLCFPSDHWGILAHIDIV
jgi:tyrosyl-DNA phosphodiesterase 2